MTTACHHCDDPGCLNGCPVNAYDKDPVTGIVKHLDDQCIGCKYCTMMCPYEVPQYSERLGIVRKCDMCSQRLAVGEAPACVQSCPNEAISIRIVDASVTPASNVRLAPGAPPSRITRPTTAFVGLSELQISAAIPQDDAIDEPAESHWPLAAMLVLTQASVGLLAVERLMFLLASTTRSEWDLNLTKWSLLVSLGVGLLGLGIAPLHLGQPTRAWKIFLGLRTSWLSREAVALGNYVALLLVSLSLLGLPGLGPLFAMSRLGLPGWLPSAILAGTIGMGLLALYSSAMIYIVTRRELWSAQQTLPQFGLSALLTGCATWCAISAATHSPAWWLQVFGVIACLALLGWKTRWEWKRCYGRAHAEDTPLRLRSRKLVQRPLRPRLTTRLLLAACSAAFLIGGSLVLSSGVHLTAACALSLATVATVSGEFCERLLYFSSVVHERMPGTMK